MVNCDVLIPRLETEKLVKWALESTKSGEGIPDLSTGSEVIVVALVKQAQDRKIGNLILCASGTADAALRKNEKNPLEYDLDVRTCKASVLAGLEKFDTITSNPPYIKISEKDLMDTNVIKNEPDTALYGGEDGLGFYRKFAKQIRLHLYSHGQLFLEFSFSEEDRSKDLFGAELPDLEIKLKNDLVGKSGMIHERWKK